jgi:hypothetical protein
MLTSPTLFLNYPTNRKTVVASYAVALTLFATSVLVAIVGRNRSSGRRQRTASVRPPAQCGWEARLVATALAAFALVASLLHVSAKQEFFTEWTRQKALLSNLRGLAPQLMDDTFVVIVDERPNRGSAPYMTHDEISAYLLALYDNWSIMGNTPRHLRFSREGVTSTYHGLPPKWFARGTRGPVRTHGVELTSTIPYDRIVLFRHDGRSLTSLPRLAVTTDAGEPLIVMNNPERILREAQPVTTPVWHHIAADVH